MASELAFVLINYYTIAKSRTGGVIGRFMSRTGLDLAAARIFAPGMELVETYASQVENDRSISPPVRRLLVDYIRASYAPDPTTGRKRRVLMILLEGEDAIRKVRDMAGPPTMGGGETIRDTFGDYVVDDNNNVRYFEPAVLIGSSRENTAATLKLWSRYAVSDGGFLQTTVDNNPAEPGWQRTLVLIKPDSFRFPSAKPGNIIDLLSRSGLRIIASKVHRMSVEQAEEFYKPVRKILREKMKHAVAERAVKALTAELGIAIPESMRLLFEENLGPLFSDEQFNQIIKFMTGSYPPACPLEDRKKDGPSKCLALVYAGVDAVGKIRSLLGATDPSKAQLGSVRREFGLDTMVNAAHASDSVENAEREIGIINMTEDLITPWVTRYYG